MDSLPQEFMALCRQWGEAQQRCSKLVAAQAAQLEALSAEVMRLRAAVIIRDTRLAWAQDALAQWQAAQPGLPRRQSMARHIGGLAERITALSRECLRWKLAASAPSTSSQAPADSQNAYRGKEVAVEERAPAISDVALHTSLAAADWVICQTGCISHDQYWRVQDHCRRTGKTCILMDQPLAAQPVQPPSAVVLQWGHTEERQAADKVQ
ncbi:DUF2325 domain-containing protein [Acidovorax sp. M14]|uniref:DUF2325 domain-containing protein n=1 Tax=Acidovorax sp. M14 TaxID=3411354 RepID=UPI003BF5C215